jgi:acetyl esterase/lipase
MVDFELRGASWQSNAGRDGFVTRELVQQNVSVFLPGKDPADASPLNQDLEGLPPLLVQVGEREVLRDDGVAFAEKARAAGVDVTLEIWPDMIHLWHAFVDLPEAGQALERIGRFVEERTADAAST